MCSETISTFSPKSYTLKHTFCVLNFDHIVDTYPNEKKLMSVSFGNESEDAECVFNINLYPNGSKHTFQGYLGVFLHIAAQDSEEQTEDSEEGEGEGEEEEEDLIRLCCVEFALEDEGGNQLMTRKASHPLRAKKPTDTHRGMGHREKSNWGFRRFKSNDDIAQYLQSDGKLILSCRVVVVCPGLEIRVMGGSGREKEAQEAWMRRIGTLKVDKTQADVAIRIEERKEQTQDQQPGTIERRPQGRESEGSEEQEGTTDTDEKMRQFAVHKCLLSAQSGFFTGLFRSTPENGPVSANPNSVTIHGVSERTFELLLDFVYTGQLKDIDAQENAATVYAELLRAADMYCMDPLKNVCENRLGRLMDYDNVVRVASILSPYSSPDLEWKIKETLKAKGHKVLESQDWIRLRQEDPDSALDILSKAFAPTHPC